MLVDMNKIDAGSHEVGIIALLADLKLGSRGDASETYSFIARTAGETSQTLEGWR